MTILCCPRLYPSFLASTTLTSCSKCSFGLCQLDSSNTVCHWYIHFTKPSPKHKTASAPATKLYDNPNMAQNRRRTYDIPYHNSNESTKLELALIWTILCFEWLSWVRPCLYADREVLGIRPLSIVFFAAASAMSSNSNDQSISYNSLYTIVGSKKVRRTC